MDTVQPRIIQSPISGQPVKPQLRTYKRGNQEITEAHWIDPSSGTFLHKGLVQIKDIEPNQKTT